MKKFLLILMACVICTVISACSSQIEEPNDAELSSETFQYNDPDLNSDITRSPGISNKVDDQTIEIVKADLIGAIEGALKGLDYAINQNLSKDEAIGVIVISAVTHGAARSHQAYTHYHDKGYEQVSIGNETYNTGETNTNTITDLAKFSKDIV